MRSPRGQVDASVRRSIRHRPSDFPVPALSGCPAEHEYSGSADSLGDVGEPSRLVLRCLKVVNSFVHAPDIEAVQNVARPIARDNCAV